MTGVEVSNYVTANMRVSQIALSVSDNAGRIRDTIDESDVDSIMMDFVNTNLQDLVKYMAEVTGRNFVISDDLKGEITIISHKPVSVAEAYEAFLSALAVEGYTTVSTGKVPCAL